VTGQLPLWARSAFHTLEDLGLQPLKLLALCGLPSYLRDLNHFRRLQRQATCELRAAFSLAPMLADRYVGAGAGSGRSLYFLQDLICSTYVLRDPPCQHLDVGSRVDGFVAQIAASRPIEVLDIRPMVEPPCVNLIFRQGDILNPHRELCNNYPLVSSLHALEHIGLGRYGDAIAPDGFERAVKQCAALVAPHGRFLLSLPVAQIPRHLVQFNSQRLFAARQLTDLLSRMLPGFVPVWTTLIDQRRKPITTEAEPDLLLETFEGFGLVAMAWQRR